MGDGGGLSIIPSFPNIRYVIQTKLAIYFYCYTYSQLIKLNSPQEKWAVSGQVKEMDLLNCIQTRDIENDAGEVIMKTDGWSQYVGIG